MNIFFTADMHLGHSNILKYTNRQYSNIYDMDRGIIDNFNSIVGKKDLTYILGDFAWHNHVKYLNELNGKKILVKGDHDKMSQDVLQQFTRVYDFGANLQIDGQRLTLCHWPMKSWRKSFNGRSWHFYGHVHGRMPEYPDVYSSDVGVDVWACFPAPWEVLKKKMQDKQEKQLQSKNELDERVQQLLDLNMNYFSLWRQSGA